MWKSIVTAVVIAVAATVWILSGQFDLDGDARRAAAVGSPDQPATEETDKAEPRALPQVRGRTSFAEAHPLTIQVRGRTESLRHVDVRAEAKGRVVSIDQREGARVKAGDPIVRLATEDRAIRRDEWVAVVRQRKLEHKAAKSLRKKGFRAETQLAAAAANLTSAQASLKRAQVELENLTIRAPFDGVIENFIVEIGDYLQVADPVMTVVDEDPFLVVGQVSESEIKHLQVGGKGEATLIDGTKVAGVIRYVGTVGDSATRTFRVELEVPNPDRSLRDGLTAEIGFESKTVMAHYLSPAVLTLNDDGIVGVRCVDEEGRVIFHPAKVIGDSPNGVWLADLPNELRLITVGQEFVRAGDKVRLLDDDAEQKS